MPLLFLPIRDLRRIRRFLSLSVAKTIATALVSSILDYCNSLLYNTASKDIAKLQRVQHCLARAVTSSPRFSAAKITALVTCALSHHFQNLYNSLSSTLIYTTSIYKFNANSSKKFQTATPVVEVYNSNRIQICANIESMFIYVNIYPRRVLNGTLVDLFQ